MEKLVGPTDLRAQAQRFRDAALKLDEAADVLEGIPAHSPTSKMNQPTPLRVRRGRINEMITMLKQEPLPAKTIVERMKVSRGAVYAWLSDREMFENKGGNWHLKSQS